MIIVTGGAGFIGSNIIKALNKAGHSDILAVDNLHNGAKFTNIADCKIIDYLDKNVFIERIARKEHITYAAGGKIAAIFHQGACSSTTEWNGEYMLRNNFEYSKTLLHYCLEQNIPLIYASSAAVYGGSSTFREEPECEKPLNIYGYSKLLFDNYVRHFLPLAKSQIVGLRYFNVYGPREQHKEKMASVAMHLNEELKRDDAIKLFAGTDGFTDGEQRRDFIYVEDVAAVNLWFWQHPENSGIFNSGTGKSASFNEVARAVATWHKRDLDSVIKYTPFPENLRGFYQSFTEADISKLRNAGYDSAFKDVANGVKDYLDWLNRT